MIVEIEIAVACRHIPSTGKSNIFGQSVITGRTRKGIVGIPICPGYVTFGILDGTYADERLQGCRNEDQ